jgi:hypothetical protein
MQELSKRKIAFVFSRSKQGEGGIDAQLKEIFGGVYIANQMLDKEKAENLLQMQKADAVAFGVLMIAVGVAQTLVKRGHFADGEERD